FLLQRDHVAGRDRLRDGGIEAGALEGLGQRLELIQLLGQRALEGRAHPYQLLLDPFLVPAGKRGDHRGHGRRPQRRRGEKDGQEDLRSEFHRASQQAAARTAPAGRSRRRESVTSTEAPSAFTSISRRTVSKNSFHATRVYLPGGTLGML